MAIKKTIKKIARPKSAATQLAHKQELLLVERKRLKQQVKELLSEIDSRVGENEGFKLQIKNLEGKLDDSRNEIMSLEEDLEQKDNELKELQESIENDSYEDDGFR